MNNIPVSESKGSATASAFATDPPKLWDLPSIASALYPRFSILELLDESEESAIFLAQDESASSTGLVKLKVISEQAVIDRKKLELFYLEAGAAAKLSHKNIIKTWKAEQIGNLHFYAIEHKPDCESLRSLLDLRAWLDTQLAAAITLQIAEALDYAHRQGVMHLKLQPESILIDPEGTALVTDFGLEDKDDLRWAHQARAQSMPVFYCSPEQASGQDVDAHSDLYSLGVILYEMLTDRVPFDYQNPAVVMHKHRTQMPEPPDVFRSDLPAPVSAVVMSLLEKQPLKRPQTPAHLQAVLNKLVQKQETAEISLNEPVLDIEIDDEIISSPIIDEDNTATIFSEELSPLSYPEGNAYQIEWDNLAPPEDDFILKPVPHEEIESTVARKRERFEPPTITVIEPPLPEVVEPIHITENPVKAIASPQSSFAVIGQSAPTEMRVKLFLILLLIIFAALALTLLVPANPLKLFRSQAPTDAAVEPATKEGSTDAQQPAKPALSDAKDQASGNGDAGSIPSENSVLNSSDKKRTSSRVQGFKAGTTSRYSLKKPVIRTAPRRVANNRAARYAKRSKWRTHRN